MPASRFPSFSAAAAADRIYSAADHAKWQAMVTLVAWVVAFCLLGYLVASVQEFAGMAKYACSGVFGLLGVALKPAPLRALELRRAA